MEPGRERQKGTRMTRRKKETQRERERKKEGEREGRRRSGEKTTSRFGFLLTFLA